MWPLAYLYIWSFAFLLSLILVVLCLKFAQRVKLVDEPGPRKIQVRPVPLLGGVGMMLGFFGTIFINMSFLKWATDTKLFVDWMPPEIIDYAPRVFKISGHLLAILIGSLIVFLVGLIDDIKDLGAWPKLTFQVLAAAILFFSGMKITLFTHFWPANLVITVLWVVAITNAFNLLDNMDGLSAGVALISSVFLLLISISEAEYFVSTFLCAFIGCLLAFLIFNFNPAKIFMGDSGSYFIGFMVASVTILGTYYRENASTMFTILMPVLILGVPIYDLLSVIFIRLHQKHPIFKGDKRHFSHRLVALGMNHRGAVLFIYLVSFAFGTASLLIGMVKEWGLYLIFLQTVAFVAIVAVLEYFGKRKNHV